MPDRSQYERPVTVNGEAVLSLFREPGEPLREMDIAQGLAMLVAQVYGGAATWPSYEYAADGERLTLSVQVHAPMLPPAVGRVAFTVGTAPSEFASAMPRESWVLEVDGEPQVPAVEVMTCWVHPQDAQRSPSYPAVRLNGVWWTRTGAVGTFVQVSWPTLVEVAGGGRLATAERCPVGLRTRPGDGWVRQCLLPPRHDYQHVVVAARPDVVFEYFSDDLPGAVKDVRRAEDPRVLWSLKDAGPDGEGFVTGVFHTVDPEANFRWVFRDYGGWCLFEKPKTVRRVGTWRALHGLLGDGVLDQTRQCVRGLRVLGAFARTERCLLPDGHGGDVHVVHSLGRTHAIFRDSDGDVVPDVTR
jgi:hypothetical protein